MPRLSALGPTVAASSTDVHARLFVAATDGDGIVLYDGADHRELGRVAVPVGEAPEIGFCTGHGGEARLVLFARGETTTDVRAFAVPTLAPAGRLEMVGTVVPVAWAGTRIVVHDGTGHSPRVVTVTPRALTSQPVALREPIQLATATPENRVLAAARDQLETWDVALGRVLYRVQLPVVRPRMAGFSARRRLMWVIGGPAPAPMLEVFRVSDGRAQGRLSLDAAARAADGQCDSERVLLVTDGGFALVDVTTMAATPLEHEGTPTAMALLEGDAAAMVTVDAGGVRFARLAPSALYAASVGERRASEIREAEQARARLAEQAAERARRPPPSQKRAASVEATPRPSVETAKTGWRERLGKAPEAPPDVDEAPPVEAAEPEEIADVVADTELGWRDWLAALVGGRGDIHLLSDGATAELAEQLQLSPLAGAALGLLYGAWLRGTPAAPATLVAQLGRAVPEQPPESRWAEATAVGELGVRGLVRSGAHGVRLTRAVGRFLDGAPPWARLVRHEGDMPPQGVEPRLYRTTLDGVELTAQRAARAFGGTIAVVDVRSLDRDSARRRLRRGLLEAELHAATPLVLVSETAPDDETLQGRVAVVAVDGAAPDWIARLPSLD